MSDKKIMLSASGGKVGFKKSVYDRLKEWKDYATEQKGKNVSWSELLTELLDDVDMMSATFNDSVRLRTRLNELEIEEEEND